MKIRTHIPEMETVTKRNKAKTKTRDKTKQELELENRMAMEPKTEIRLTIETVDDCVSVCVLRSLDSVWIESSFGFRFLF
jgi:hypothetical protein